MGASRKSSSISNEGVSQANEHNNGFQGTFVILVLYQPQLFIWRKLPKEAEI